MLKFQTQAGGACSSWSTWLSRARLDPRLLPSLPLRPARDARCPSPRACPTSRATCCCCPSSSLLWPAVLYFHGLYQIRRGRSRIDEFFAILFSVLSPPRSRWARRSTSASTTATSPRSRRSGSTARRVFALFVVLDVLLLNLGRARCALLRAAVGGRRERQARARGGRRRAGPHRGRDAAGPPRARLSRGRFPGDDTPASSEPRRPPRARDARETRAGRGRARAPTRSTWRCRSRSTPGSSRSSGA